MDVRKPQTSYLRDGPWNMAADLSYSVHSNNFRGAKKTTGGVDEGVQGGDFRDPELGFGRLDGLQKEWYRNGNLSRKMEFNQGRQEGGQIGWKENGDLRFKYTYINGKRYGFMGTSLCQGPEG